MQGFVPFLVSGVRLAISLRNTCSKGRFQKAIVDAIAQEHINIIFGSVSYCSVLLVSNKFKSCIYQPERR